MLNDTVNKISRLIYILNELDKGEIFLPRIAGAIVKQNTDFTFRLSSMVSLLPEIMCQPKHFRQFALSLALHHPITFPS